MAGRYQEEAPMEEHMDRGLLGMFGKKKDEGRNDQDAQYETQSKPYGEKGSGNYGQQSAGEFNKAPPSYNQNTHGGAYGDDFKRYDEDAQYETQSKPSGGQGIGSYGQESAGGFNQAQPTYNQNTGGGAYGEEGKRNGCSSSSSDEEGQGGRVREEGQGGGVRKKGLKEKIKEKLPGQHGNKREGEMQGNY